MVEFRKFLKYFIVFAVLSFLMKSLFVYTRNSLNPDSVSNGAMLHFGLTALVLVLSVVIYFVLGIIIKNKSK